MSKYTIEDVRSAFVQVKEELKWNIELKEQQEQLIHAIVNGQHVFGILPTGFGKSMCFALPPLILNKVRNLSGI